MKTCLLLACCLLVFPAGPALAEDAPHELAGFVLGGKMARFSSAVKPDTRLPIRYLESVKQVEMKPVPGIKTGLVDFGSCGGKEQVLRIKVKYADQSRDFFDKLLKKCRKRFGEPDQFRGDPFHVVIAWKWSFKDKKGHRISLVLQHNTLDQDERIGNTAKLTDWTLLNAQRKCQEKEQAPRAAPAPAKGRKLDWGLLVPR